MTKFTPSSGLRHIAPALDQLRAELEARRERSARLGRLACDLDDLVLEIASGPLDDELLYLAPSAAYLAISLRALDAVLDEVEFGITPAALRDAA